MRAGRQKGWLERKGRSNGCDVWVYRRRELRVEGVKQTSFVVGTVEEYPTENDARTAAEARLLASKAKSVTAGAVTLGLVIERYKLEKLPKRYSTRVSYLSCLNVHIMPMWKLVTLDQIAKQPFLVEDWLENLKLAPKTKGHLKSLMNRLFECAMKWGMYTVGRNPMELVEVRNVTKRQRKPRVLTYDEFLKILAFLKEPYRTMVLIAQCLGLRISEVMALQWGDFNFSDLTVRVQRSIVHGRVDSCKTEYSDEDLPIDSDLAGVLLRRKAGCPATPEGWVFPSPETGKPYWQESACTNHIRPAAVQAAVGGAVGWHTFRHTYRSWLDAEGTPITLQRELMRHASIQTTMNVYGRPTMTEAKRKANSNVARMALKSEPGKTVCSPVAPSKETLQLTGSD